MASPLAGKSNRWVRVAAGLSQRKKREESGLYLIEGTHHIRGAIDAAGVAAILHVPGYGGAPAEEALLAAAAAAGVAAYEAEDSVLRRVAATETPPGVIGLARIPPPLPMEALADPPPAGRRDAVVILDRVQDPGNVGSILRVAHAFGLRAEVSLRGTADRYAPKAVRASAAAVAALPEVRAADAASALRALGEAGYAPIVLDSREGEAIGAGGKPASGRPWPERPAFLVGAEGGGVSPGIAAGSAWPPARRVRIPMIPGADSLNVAVALGIVLFAVLGPPG